MDNIDYKIEFNEDILRISFIGEINHHCSAALRKEIDEKLCELCPKRVLLDLSQLNDMDASGVGFILGRHSLVQQWGGEVMVENAHGKILRLLELAGMGKIIKINVADSK